MAPAKVREVPRGRPIHWRSFAAASASSNEFHGIGSDTTFASNDRVLRYARLVLAAQ